MVNFDIEDRYRGEEDLQNFLKIDMEWVNRIVPGR